MKRITLAVLSLVAASAVGVAQEPPTPPTPPTPPAPTPRPMAVPRLAPMPMRDYDYRIDQEQVREIQRQAQEMARENMRIDQQHVREMAQEASRMALENSRIDIERVREQARIDARDFAYAMPMEIPTPRIAPMPAMPMIAPTPMIAPMAPFAYGRGDFTNRPAPAPWIQGDPADSVYQLARNALNNGDYGRAARLFGELVSKYQKSQYQDAGMY